MTEADNVRAWREIEAELELEIDDATQFATVYRGGRPIATAQRRRVLEKNGPAWQIFAPDGRKIFDLWFSGPVPAARIKRRLAAHLVDQDAAAMLEALRDPASEGPEF